MDAEYGRSNIRNFYLVMDVQPPGYNVPSRKSHALEVHEP
jgi:hypothetical protein